jgi:transposase
VIHRLRDGSEALIRDVDAGAQGDLQTVWARSAERFNRAAMNGIFYLLRTGCPWRYLPRGAFPPRSTVYNIFRQFQRDGVWERIWEELHMALREALGREASPTAAILDSQSLKAAEKGEPRAGVKRTQWVMTPARR